jgi:hypothetical protein
MYHQEDPNLAVGMLGRRTVLVLVLVLVLVPSCVSRTILDTEY